MTSNEDYFKNKDSTPGKKPKVIEIDCKKWQNVIGITLWCGATIGLGIGMYGLFTYMTFQDNSTCFLSYDIVLIGKIHHNLTCNEDGGLVFNFMWLIALVSNGGNYFAIWSVLNNHFKWLEIRCRS